MLKSLAAVGAEKDKGKMKYYKYTHLHPTNDEIATNNLCKGYGKMQSSEGQTTRVIFQIFSPMLNLNDLSKNIHLKPDHTHLLGDYPRANPKYAPYKHGMWLLRSKLSDELSLEAHLENLISVLEPYQDYIRILSENNKVHFTCVLHSQNGFEISPSILARMSKLGASFGAEIYPPDTENENDSQFDPHH